MIINKKCFFTLKMSFFSVKEKHSHFNERGLIKQTKHIERGI